MLRDPLHYLLLAHATRRSKEFLYTHPEYRPTLWERLRFRYFLWRHHRGWPLAYITHRQEFYGLDFYVNRSTLIPRPDTEVMVEKVIKTVAGRRSAGHHPLLLVDVGTGSGCIPIAVVKQLETVGATLPTVIASDISYSALWVARRNARQHDANITFLHGNLLEPITRRLSTFDFTDFIITANLPYLTQQQFDEEASIQHEPHSALVAQNGSLSLYEQLFQQLNLLILPSSNLWGRILIFLEIDPSQTTAMIQLIRTSLPQANVEITKDLAGRDRVVKISIT